MAVRELSDAELITGARKGDSDAYGELYRRHVDSARAAARALTRSHSDADDLTSEAFARVLRALQSGGGPEVSFRPYLVTAVRNVFYDKVRRNREEPSPDMSDEVNVALLDAASSQEDGAFAAAAFATLPERWQLVLWHTEVEGRSVAEVAPLLGLAPNAVAALAYRAREGLRQAYLQAHLRDQQVAECRECASSLGAYVRDGLSARDRRRVDAHLDGCASCTALVAELTDTNNTLRAALIPALIGVSSAAYLSGLGGKGLLAWLTRIPKTQLVVAGSTAAASVLAVATFAGVFGGGRDATATPPTIASTVVSQKIPVSDSSAPPRSSVPPSSSTPSTSSELPTTSEPAIVPSATSTPTSLPRNSSTVAPVPTVRPGNPTRPTTTVPVTIPQTPTTPPVTPTTPPTTIAPATTTPATTPATTTPATTPATTTPAAPATLTVTAVQRSAALANGQFRLQLTVTNTGATTVNGIQLNVPVPTGASFLRAEGVTAPVADLVRAYAPDWSCSGNVSCTLPALSPGQSSELELTFAVSSSAPASFTLTPTISAPADAVVTSLPITVQVTTIANLLVAETERGALRAIGNTVVTCADTSPNCAEARAGTAVGAVLDHNAHVMQYVNKAGGTFNSSSAQLVLTGTSVRAYLVWAGDLSQGGSAPSPADFNKVTFTTPAGTSVVTANDWRNFDEAVRVNTGMYTAYADVTALVAGSGTYSVSNIQTALGAASFGGWSLIVIDHDSSMPERFMMVTAPLTAIINEPQTWMSFTVALPQPMANATGAMVVAGFEGDRSLLAEQVSLSGFVVANPFQGKILGVRDPAFQNSLGTDVMVVATSGMNGSQFTFSATTNNDRVIIPLVAVALDL